jgi:hypothetical protein
MLARGGATLEDVLLISVDGMTNWIAAHPNGNFAMLAAHGVQ